MRPLIGVTGPDRGGEAAWLFTSLAIRLAGGRPVHITPARPRSAEGLHGVVLGGGADVAPHLYGQERSLPRNPPSTRHRTLLRIMLDIIVFPVTWIVRTVAARANGSGIDLDRDRLEQELIRQAVARNLPILGICRGEQLLNVHFGGTLHQELTGLYSEAPEIRTILPRKLVDVATGSRLASALGPEPCWVNALHRQGVDALGRGIKATAKDRIGIIQEVENESYPFVIGVQWHPEFLPQAPRQRKLFRAFVEEARLVLERGEEPGAPEAVLEGSPG